MGSEVIIIINKIRIQVQIINKLGSLFNIEQLIETQRRVEQT
jgi:hypothetical protein